MKIKVVTLTGFRHFGDSFVIKVPEGNNANVVFTGCRQQRQQLFEVLALALSFSNEPDPFFDAELITHGTATVKIEFQHNGTNDDCSRVVLERMITRAKVSNKLDGNDVERIEIVHFLELLEFSRTHPFTFHIRTDDIERFGDPTDAITAADRWTILQQLIGVEEFLKAKSRSQRILDETEQEIRAIDAMLRKYNNQIEIIMKSSAPDAYVELVKRKTQLEHCHREKCMATIRDSIEKCSTEIDELQTACAQHEQDLRQIDVEAIASRQKKLLLDRQIATETQKRQQLASSMSEMQRIRDLLNESVVETRKRLRADEMIVSFAEEEKLSVCQMLEEKQRELDTIIVEYTRLSEHSNELRLQMAPFEQRCQHLIMNAKQNVRMNWKFCTENDRNTWIDAELVSLAKEIKRKETNAKRSVTEFETRQRMYQEKRDELKRKTIQHDEYGSAKDGDFEETVQRLIQKRDAALKNKEYVLRQIEKKQSLKKQIHEKLPATENELRKVIGEDLMNGLKSMEVILNSDLYSKKWQNSCKGLVIDHLREMNANDEPAVGVLAGARLFHHIVDSVEAATALIRMLNEKHMRGEVFFIVESEIKSAGDINNWLALSSVEPPDPFYGDNCDMFISCIPIYRERSHLLDLMAACAHDLRTFDYNLDTLVRSIEETEKNIQDAKNLCERHRDSKHGIEQLVSALDDLDAKMRAKEKSKNKIGDELNALVKRKLQLESERNVAFLTNDEQATVNVERQQIDAVDVIYRRNMDAMNELRTRQDNLSRFIETYLKRKQRELDEVSVSYISQSELLERDASELSDTDERLREFADHLNPLNDVIDELNKQLFVVAKEFQEQRQRKKDLSASIARDTEEKARLMTEHNQLKTELTKLQRATTQTINVDERVEQLTTTEMEQELQEVDHQLTVFKKTNRFDFDRLENFKIDQQRLNLRLVELKKNGVDLNRVIVSMNAGHEKATSETMSQLQASFTYLFHRIIDREECAGHLELQSNENDQKLDILCTFSDIEMPFESLPLTEKRVVALIFILSVLQSSPYAIYLLDHIDEDIDERHRRNIAEYIQERSDVSQFFVAADHTEFLSPFDNILELTSSQSRQVKVIRPLMDAA